MDNQSLEGFDNQQALDVLRSTGQTVCLALVRRHSGLPNLQPCMYLSPSSSLKRTFSWLRSCDKFPRAYMHTSCCCSFVNSTLNNCQLIIIFPLNSNDIPHISPPCCSFHILYVIIVIRSSIMY